MKAVLLAKSSSGESYQVEFLSDGDSLKVFCHCKAGIQQWVCKHKLALLKADVAMLFDPTQSALLSEILAWPEFEMLKPRIDEYERKLDEIELAKSDLLKQEKAIKSVFGRGLTHGFE